MIEFLENLGINPLIISPIIGIIGICMGIYFFIKGRKRKEALYNKSSFNLISNKLSTIKDVKILYKEQELSNFTVTKIVIWNGGNDTILREDFTTEELSIEVINESKLLDYELIHQSDSTISCKLNRKSESRLIIDFEYLNASHGIAIKIFHTGTSSDEIIVNGKFKGFGKIKEGESLTRDGFGHRQYVTTSVPVDFMHIITFYKALYSNRGAIIIFLILMSASIYGTIKSHWTFIFAVLFCLLAVFRISTKKNLPRKFETLLEEKESQ